jgi:hypothetical protein
MLQVGELSVWIEQGPGCAGGSNTRNRASDPVRNVLGKTERIPEFGSAQLSLG